MVDPRGGTDRTLYETDAQLGWVSGAPDGSVVAVVEAICSDRLVVAGDLLLIDPESGDVRRVDTLDVDVAWLAWRADGTLLATGVRGLDTVVLDVDPVAGAAKERWATSEAGRRPVPVRRARRRRRRDHAQLRGPPTRDRGRGATTSRGRSSPRRTRGRMSWRPPWRRDRCSPGRRPDGLEIQGFLTLPAGDGPFPLILDVHGGPVWAYADFWPGAFLGFFLARGYALLQPNPRGSWGRGRDFASRVVGDMGGADALRPARRRGSRDRPWGRRSRADRCLRRELRRLHGGAAPLPRSALRGLGVDRAGDRLVLRAVRQQPRCLGAGLPGRRSARPAGPLPRAEPRPAGRRATGPRRS